jgi:hypothetical protein
VSHSPKSSLVIFRGETLIGVGLTIFIAAGWWPNAPVVTVMAIIALGATEATISRFRGLAAALPVVVLHGVTYVLLYVLFIGARLHGAAAASEAGISGFAALDLTASLVPMALALKHVSSCLRQSIMPRR